MEDNNNNNEEFPSIKEQGKNLAKFTIQVVKDSVMDINSSSSNLFASNELKEERMSICKKCEYYSPRQVRCKQCGCWLTQKIKFTNSKCPIERW